MLDITRGTIIGGDYVKAELFYEGRSQGQFYADDEDAAIGEGKRRRQELLAIHLSEGRSERLGSQNLPLRTGREGEKTMLNKMIERKLSQWDNEKVSAARRAFAEGRTATLVEYPTGLQMMRFAEPYSDYGMHFEVKPEVWSVICQ